MESVDYFYTQTVYPRNTGPVGVRSVGRHHTVLDRPHPTLTEYITVRQAAKHAGAGR